MSDPITAALDEVEAGESESPGLTDADERADPTADDDGDLGDDLPGEVSSEPTSVFGRLREPLEGSIKDDRIGELWNPEQGGANRVVLSVEEAFGVGDGLPRAVHLIIGLGEIYVEEADGLNFDLGGSSADADDDEETEIRVSDL